MYTCYFQIYYILILHSTNCSFRINNEKLYSMSPPHCILLSINTAKCRRILSNHTSNSSLPHLAIYFSSQLPISDYCTNVQTLPLQTQCSDVFQMCWKHLISNLQLSVQWTNLENWLTVTYNSIMPAATLTSRYINASDWLHSHVLPLAKITDYVDCRYA